MNLDGSVPCHLCWAQVPADLGLKHRAWHVAHDLHAADCDVVKVRRAQSGTDMYITPRPCSCGLA